jgi:hypothetical protein
VRARDARVLPQRAAGRLERAAGVLPAPEAGDGDERGDGGEDDAEPDDEVEDPTVAVAPGCLGVERCAGAFTRGLSAMPRARVAPALLLPG